LLAVTSAVALTVVLLGFWVPVSWRSSDGGIDRVAKRAHDAGIFVQSTLVAYDTFRTSGRTALVDDPVVEFLMPSTREAWRKSEARHTIESAHGVQPEGCRHPAPQRRAHHGWHRRNGTATSRARQFTSQGTPAPVSKRAFTLRSHSVCDSGARHISGKTKEFGTIAVGQRADLLLVAGNPLDNLEALRRPMGVMVRGRWLPRQRLDELLKSLAGSE